jgi:hypothetical protein
MADVFWGLGVPFATLLLFASLLVFIFEVYMLISAATNRKISDTARILWVIAILVFHFVAPAIYYFTDHKKKLVG